jgi:predicted O-methyltransferase YrrM
MNSLDDDVTLKALLTRLHAQSEAQEKGIYDWARAHMPRPGTVLSDAQEKEFDRFFRDKLVALEPDKAQFCYALCRALQAKRIVEAGTSYGVSTLYLAAAIRDNGGGTVIATEYEPEKAKKARAHFTEAGLTQFIDLREGDLRQTLKTIEGPVDFLLMDIWTPMARPAMELVAPHMRKGAIAVADNVNTFRGDYAEYFEFLNNPANGFLTRTLPFDGGFEMSVKIA